MDGAEIRRKIEALKKERDEYVAAANKNLTYWAGKIAGLEELLAPPEPPKGPVKRKGADVPNAYS